MISNTIRRSILVSILVFFALFSSAQKFTGFFHIAGRIRVDAGDPTGAVVTLINVSAKTNENIATVNSTGKFEFDLKYFKEYKLTVVKDDHYTKYIDVSTIVPPLVWAKDSLFPPFSMVVTIYKKVPDVTLSFEGKTVGKLCYNPKGKLDNFDADIYIDDKEIRKEIDQALKAHEDEFFNKKIAEAVEFEKKNQIREAIKAYEEALAIRKNDQFIKPKLRELTSDLKNLDKDALMEGQFNKLVSAGDENVAGLKFPEAIDNYKAALAIKPGNAVASGKLSNAEQLLAKAKAEADRLAAINAKAEADRLATEKAKAEADWLAAEKAKAEADRLATEKAKAEADRLAAAKAKAEADQLAAEKAKAEADRLAAEKAKAEADKLAAEKAKADADRLAAEKAKAEADRLAAEKAKAEADRLAAEKAKAESDKLAAEKAKAEADRLAAEKAKAEADRLAAEKAKAEADRLAAEKAKAEADRLAAEKAKAEADRLAAAKAKAEADRLSAEKAKAEADRLAAEKAKAEADRLAAEKAKAEADKLAAEKAKAEADRLAAEKAKAEADRLAAEKAKAEADKLAAEKAKAEADRLAAEKAKAEADRLAAEKAKAEADRLAAEKAKAEADRLAAEKAKAEADRLAAEKAKAEADQLAAEKAKAEADQLAAEKAKAEADRLAAEKAKAEADRLAAINAEKLKKEAEQQNKLQAEDSYMKNIQTGDANYTKSLWSVAIFYYEEALKFKSADKYALEKIDNCRKMIDSNISAEKMQEYNSYIKHADADMLEKKYSSARFYYGKAGVILPWENYPKGRLNEVEKLISSTDIDSNEAGYFDAVSKADDAVAKKNFAVARFYYQKAVSMKPDEEYPKQQLKRLTTEF